MSQDNEHQTRHDGVDTRDRPLPERIGSYRVVAEIGRGGMGAVYRAHEDSLNRDVAIKVLSRHLADDETVVARFTREARSTASLSHPNVVHIYSTGSENGLPYIAMEYVRGETLADLIRRERRLQPRRAAEILLQSASGLAAAHDKGIVHRDVKPANLMLDRSGHLKVTDFGIALTWDAGDRLTTTGQFVGTSGYISPEGCKGEPVDARSDIFSLGVVLYEMLAGETPFNDDSPLGMLVQVVEAKVPDVRRLNPDVDDDLLGILDRMIAKAPGDRYQTCHELIRDLSAYLARERSADRDPAPTTAPATAEMPIVRPRRRRWPAALAALLVIGAAGAGGYWVWDTHLAGPDARATRSTMSGAEAESGVQDGGASLPAPVESDPGTHDAAQAGTEPAVAGSTAEPGTQRLAAAGSESEGRGAGNALPRAGVTGSDPGTGSGGDSGAAPVEDAGGSSGTEPAGGAGESAGSAVPDVAAPADGSSATQTTGSQGASHPGAGEQVASIPRDTARAAAIAGPPRALVIASGDPVIAGPVENLLREAVGETRLELMDTAFMPGVGRYAGDEYLDVAGLGELVREEGGRLLVVARIVPVGTTPLYYYGRTSTLYTSRIELETYDLVERRRVGEGWTGEVRYTELNAVQQAGDVVAPLAEQLSRALAEVDYD